MNPTQDLQCCVTHCDKPLDANYWNNQYQQEQTGWDLGEAAPALNAYFKQLSNKQSSILIPGCGNTYEADELLALGFTNITLIDIAPALIQKLRIKYAQYSAIKIIEGDFFEHEGAYDLIIEQTFFCAIHPDLRSAYAQKMAHLLNPSGKLVGLLFDKEFEKAGPPFGGCKCKYLPFFEPYFTLNTFEKCLNSHPNRENIELFINLSKKI